MENLIIIVLFIYLFISFLLFYFYIFILKQKSTNKEWELIYTTFEYYIVGSRKDNFYFWKKIPSFLQELVHSDVFYSFLDNESKKELKEKIIELSKMKKRFKKQEFKKINLIIYGKKIECYFKFIKIDKKTKILKGLISNLLDIEKKDKID